MVAVDNLLLLKETGENVSEKLRPVADKFEKQRRDLERLDKMLDELNNRRESGDNCK
jgi:hypothetical protein